MIFDFLFGNGKKDAPETEKSASEDKAIIQALPLDLTVDLDEQLDIERYEHIALPSEEGGEKSQAGLFADRLIPLAAAAADAAARYNQAIVRFPEGAGWGDLLNRKTPGWEEWKQLGILKEGKFQPMAAIKQAKLPPTAVANLALQGAAVVVGQAYMAEISKQLDGIQSEISAIQVEMKLEREANIEASYEMLKFYLAFYSEIAADPERRQAAHAEIEDIKRDAIAAWKFQVGAMQELNASLAKLHRMKEGQLRENIKAFRAREREADAAFRVLIAAEQASMQYDKDFSVKRIEHERKRISDCLEDYSKARDGVQAALSEGIEKMRGNLLDLPNAEEDGYESEHLLLDVMHAVKVNAPRLWLPAMRKEAVDQLEAKKERYSNEAKVNNPLEDVGDARIDALDRADFMFNKANVIKVSDEGMVLLYVPDDETADTAEEAEEAN